MQNGKKPMPEPPEHLSERAQALWSELVLRRCDSTERRTLLLMALEDLDRIDALRELVAREGVFQKSTRSGLDRPHPAIRLEADARRRFIGAWRLLRLVWPKTLGFSP
jgi:phage terminase small subunit